MGGGILDWLHHVAMLCREGVGLQEVATGSGMQPPLLPPRGISVLESGAHLSLICCVKKCIDFRLPHSARDYCNIKTQDFFFPLCVM